jgi:hypothetical protein
MGRWGGGGGPPGAEGGISGKWSSFMPPFFAISLPHAEQVASTFLFLGLRMGM